MKILKIPFLLESNAKAVIVDARMSDECIKSLEDRGIQCIKTCCCKEVYEAIAYHPDIVMHPVNGKTIVVAPNVYSFLKPIIHSLGINVLKGETTLGRNYPENIAYNIARVSKFAIHNFSYTDPLILKLLEKEKVQKIHVKQGYSKCSICVVDQSAIITSDLGIAKAVKKYGIDVLAIVPGYIKLKGMNYGFIGGTCGYIGKKQLAFSGCLKNHPDYKKILDFLKRYNVSPVFLDSKQPMDVGSIIPILQMET